MLTLYMGILYLQSQASLPSMMSSLTGHTTLINKPSLKGSNSGADLQVFSNQDFFSHIVAVCILHMTLQHVMFYTLIVCTLIFIHFCHLQFSVPQIEYPLGGSSKKGSHVCFLL